MSHRRLVTNQLRATITTPALDTSVVEFHRSLPGYAVTPLRQAPAVAALLGVGSVSVKDESHRLGAQSFKMLGASWAVYRRLCALLEIDHVPTRTLTELTERLEPFRPLTLVAATDGNHGYAVARMARLLSLGCHILTPANLPAARIEELRSEGATVTVVRGDYDAAVARSAQLADRRHLVVSDTSWPGYDTVPRWVSEGYSTLFVELEEQVAGQDLPRPTLVAVQIGVGSFAGAAVRHFQGRTRLLGVEPTTACCALASVEAGRPTVVPGPHPSVMTGLNCGTPSPLAWPLISAGIDSYAAISDQDALAAVQLLVNVGIRTGATGAAGLAGVIAFADQLGLGADDHVLIIATEGAP